MVLVIILCVIVYVLIGCIVYGIFDGIDGIGENEDSNGNEWLILLWPFVVVCIVPMTTMFLLYRLGSGIVKRIKNLINK